MASRPQEPVEPVPYDRVDIQVRTPAAGVTLQGTLTTPRSAGRHPAALLITGSGPHDRDKTVFGHRPYLVVADHLTRRGLVVLRLDDRGVGASTGDRSAATTAVFAADMRAAFDLLTATPEVDPARRRADRPQRGRGDRGVARGGVRRRGVDRDAGRSRRRRPGDRARPDRAHQRALRRVACPVLALTGELDLQVPSAQNLPAIVAALEAGENRDYAVAKLPRLNHLFQTAGTGSPAEYEAIEETIAPAALGILTDWLRAHIPRASER